MRQLDGEFIKAAKAGGFDVLVSSDQGIPHEQNISCLRLGLVVLPTPDWNIVKQHLGVIADAIDVATPGSISRVIFGRTE